MDWPITVTVVSTAASLFLLSRAFSSRVYDFIIIKMTKVWYQDVISRLPNSARVLDVGIGTGSALLVNSESVLVKKLEWIGLDLDRNYVVHCNKSLSISSLRDHASVVQADIYDSNALSAIKRARAGGSRQASTEPILFDAVYFSGSFSLLPDPSGALRIAKSALKPGGLVYITQTFQHKSPPLFAYIKPALKYATTIDFGRLFYAKDVEKIVRESGLELLSMEPIKGSIDTQWQTAYCITCK